MRSTGSSLPFRSTIYLIGGGHPEAVDSVCQQDNGRGAVNFGKPLSDPVSTPSTLESLLSALVKRVIKEAFSEALLDLGKEQGLAVSPVPVRLAPAGSFKEMIEHPEISSTLESVGSNHATPSLPVHTCGATQHIGLADWDRLRKLVEDYFFARQTGRRRLEGSTAANFRSDYKQALSYFESHHTALTREALEGYVRWLEMAAKTPSGRGYALPSVVRKKTSLSSLLTWAKDKGGWPSLDHLSVLGSKKRDKTAKKPHRALAPSDDDRYLRAARELPLAERIMALLGRYCGLRAADIGKLTWSEVDFANRRMEYVAKKTGRVVRVPLDEMLNLLAQYHEVCQRESFLFPIGSGGSATSRKVLALVDRVAVSARIERHVTPHDLRKTFATAKYYEGADLLDLQEWLGHEDINTTRAYIDTTSGWGSHVRQVQHTRR